MMRNGVVLAAAISSALMPDGVQSPDPGIWYIGKFCFVERHYGFIKQVRRCGLRNEQVGPDVKDVFLHRDTLCEERETRSKAIGSLQDQWMRFQVRTSEHPKHRGRYEAFSVGFVEAPSGYRPL